MSIDNYNTMENMAVVIIASYDKNRWLLDIFFEQFFENWENSQTPIYLITEEKDYTYENRKIKIIKGGKEKFWCSRVKNAIKEISEDYVLLFLDDYIIESPVNMPLLEEYYNIIFEHKLCNIVLTTVPNEKNEKECFDNRLVKRHRFGRYKTSLQCGIWQKEVLMRLLSDSENPWEFEIFGNIRSFLEKNDFYALKNIANKPIDYNDGAFVVQGRLNLEEKTRIENKIGKHFFIPEVPVFETADKIVRNNIKFVPRVLRRLRIIIMWLLHHLRYYAFGEKIV